jgi:hypothetical protein
MKPSGPSFPAFAAPVRRLPSGLLHWLCCAFLIAYAGMNQYLYAVTDKLYLVDHDWCILHRSYANYNADPSGWTSSSLRSLLSGNAFWYAFSNFWVSAHFWLFGRTLAVSKLAMLLPLLCMALAVYGLVYSITKKELAGFLAALLSLSLPAVMRDSRTHFPFIPLAAVLLLACLFTIDNLDLRNARRCVALSVCLWLGGLVHYSAFLLFPFFFAYLLYSNKEKTRYALVLAVFFLSAAWNRADFGKWLCYAISHSPDASWKDNLLDLLRYFRSADVGAGLKVPSFRRSEQPTPRRFHIPHPPLA